MHLLIFLFFPRFEKDGKHEWQVQIVSNSVRSSLSGSGGTQIFLEKEMDVNTLFRYGISQGLILKIDLVNFVANIRL